MSVSGADQANRPWWSTGALVQGILSPLLFLLIVVLGALARPDYSHVVQAISELTMAGAPNKMLLDIGLTATELMNIAFGLGYFWCVRAWGTRFRISAALIVFIGVIGLAFAPFPMDPIGATLTQAGRVHIMLAAVSSLATMAVIIFAAFGWRTRRGGGFWFAYSFVSFAIVFAAGLLSAIAIAQGWSNVGLWQRLSVAAFLLWKALLAFELLHRTRNMPID